MENINIYDIINNLDDKLSGEENLFERLDMMFSMYVKIDNDFMIEDIQGHLENEFQIDGKIIIDLIAMDRSIINREKTESYILNVINKIDKKYGYLIKKKLIIDRNPFAIGSVDLSVESSSSNHTIKFKRNDGEILSANVNANSMFNIATVLISGIDLALKTGIYNIDGNILKNYEEAALNLNKTIQEIKNRR